VRDVGENGVTAVTAPSDDNQAVDPDDEECPGCEVCNGKTYPAHPDAIPAGELTWERMVELQPELRDLEKFVQRHIENNLPLVRGLAEQLGNDPDAAVLSENWSTKGIIARYLEDSCAVVPELCSDHARVLAENHLTAGIPG
jgi:hypothetical protein